MPHSGCHCTPSAARGRARLATASIVPSGAQRFHHKPSAGRVDRLAVERVHLDGRGSDDAREVARTGSGDGVAGILVVDRAGPGSMIHPVGYRAPLV